ncbi:MAG: sulfatase-like hydrolase/transferase [Verrucomicrobiota bacterium]
MMTRTIKALFLTLILITSNALSAEKPHIILVMADDQGWGQMGYNGHPELKTPHFDEMAANGLRFDRFYAGASNCSPSRATVLTGRSNDRTGVYNHGYPLRLQEKTLPQALQKAGYATGHFGKWHLNGLRGPGIPVLADDTHSPGAFGFDHWLTATNYFDLNPLLGRMGEFESFEGDSSEVAVEEALKFIAERASSQPTFTVIWFGTPHDPMIATEEDRAPFAHLPEKTQHQYGEIVAMDRSIGMLRDRLRTLGLANDTLIWFCSDNGGREHDPHSQAGLRGYKGGLYEGGIRVPGLIEWPGKIVPQVTDFPASTMDIMPTIVDLLDLPEDSMLEVVDGESIVSLFTGDTPQRTRPIPIANKGMALLDDRYKIVRNGNGKGVPWELFDLDNDLGETTDLATQSPERFERMKAEALAVEASIAASALGQDYPEGKVLQPQRSERWEQMKEYQALYERFAELKPGWQAPTPKPGKKKQK